MNRAVVILAAGKGTRMNSNLPKVLHKLESKPLVLHVLDAAQSIEPEKTVLVVGYQKEKVINATLGYPLMYAFQEKQLGTAHALMQAQHLLTNKNYSVLLLSGDVPLLSSETIESLFFIHHQKQAAATILTSILEDPSGYGRIVRSSSGEIKEIIEECDASSEIKAINEVNGGIYIFESPLIFTILQKIKTDNSQGEYYLPDAIKLLVESGEKVESFVLQDPEDLLNINTPSSLLQAEKILSRRSASFLPANSGKAVVAHQ